MEKPDKPIGPAGLCDEDDDDPTILLPRDMDHWSLNDGWFYRYLHQGVSPPRLPSETELPKQSGDDAKLMCSRRAPVILMARQARKAARKHSGKDANSLRASDRPETYRKPTDDNTDEPGSSLAETSPGEEVDGTYGKSSDDNMDEPGSPLLEIPPDEDVDGSGSPPKMASDCQRNIQSGQSHRLPKKNIEKLRARFRSLLRYLDDSSLPDLVDHFP